MPPTMERQLQSTYYRVARSKGKWWEGCHACPPDRKDPKALLQVHHVIEQQTLKRVAKDRKWSQFKLLTVLWDPRNSMLLDETCHHLHTVKSKRLPISAVSEAAWEFAAEYDLTDIIVREYRA